MEGFAFSSKFLWVTLLLWASSGKSTDAVSRAIASLSPSWRVLSGTNVTFSCEDPSNSSSNEIKWFHNGSSISFRTSSFSIIVSVGNSGEYRCQTSNSTRSDPIYLGVYIARRKRPKDTSKALLSLNPPWNRIFRGENVTLHCKESKNSSSSKTNWYYNNSLITEVETRNYSINFATINSSGQYRCRTSDYDLSDPMNLRVFSDWLLIQASLEIIKEGDPLVLRCHGWKNRAVYKVTFYHNNKSLKYWYENFNFFIPYATESNSGFYHCTGILQKMYYTSEPVFIGFKYEEDKGTLRFMQILVPLMTGILFAVDTVFLVLTQKQLHNLLEKKKLLASKRPPKTDTDTESKAKVEYETEYEADPEPEPEPDPEPEPEPDPEPELMPSSLVTDVKP